MRLLLPRLLLLLLTAFRVVLTQHDRVSRASAGTAAAAVVVVGALQEVLLAEYDEVAVAVGGVGLLGSHR